MNIAYLLSATIPNGGATKAFLNILDEMTKYDVSPFVIVPDSDGVVKELKNRQIPTLVLNYRPSAYPPHRTYKETLLFVPKLAARVYVNYKATKALTTWLKENKIDIVHSNTSIVRIGFDAAQKLGIPHIYHIREFADKIGIRFFPAISSFVRQLDCSKSYSICITKTVQKHYHQNGKDDVSRVIYDGVFSAIFDMQTAKAKDFFLFAGGVQPAKGLEDLLIAYGLYVKKAKNALRLKVAGSISCDTYSNNIFKFAEENGLSEFVDFLGNRNDITLLMRESRALIVSTPFEGFGFCMPEAMQQGCLCIAHNTAGSKEQLDNALEMTGKEIALRYSTTEELANLLIEVASRPSEYYLPYTELAFKVVNQLYTKENNTKQIYEFYQYILNETNH